MRRIARLALAASVAAFLLPGLAATSWAAVAPAGGELPMGGPPPGERQRAPAAAYVGDRAVVAWEDTGGLFARFHDGTGAAASPPVLVAANDPMPEVPFDAVVTVQRQPAIAARADGFLLVWVEQKMRIRSYWFREERLLQSNKVMARLFDANGVPRTQVREVASGRNELARPAVVADAQAFFVAWQQTGGDAKGIHLRRLNDTGRPGTQLLVSPLGARPALGISGNRLLVAWDQCCGSGAGRLQVYARLVGTDAVPVGGAFGLATGPVQSEQAAVMGGRDGEFLVAWQRSPDGRQAHLYGQLVSRAGAALGPVLTLSSGQGDHGAPRLASLPDGAYLVSWVQWFGTFMSAVQAAPFDALGNASGAVVRVSVGRIVGPWSVSLAAGPGGKVLAVWEGGDEARRAGLRGRLLQQAAP
jgi:hypothetical protein